MKLDKKIVQKCTLEKAKFAILPSIHIPPETSPHAHAVAKITVPHSWHWLLNEIQIQDKLVMLKKFEKNCFSLMM